MILSLILQIHSKYNLFKEIFIEFKIKIVIQIKMNVLMLKHVLIQIIQTKYTSYFNLHIQYIKVLIIQIFRTIYIHKYV